MEDGGWAGGREREQVKVAQGAYLRWELEGRLPFQLPPWFAPSPSLGSVELSRVSPLTNGLMTRTSGATVWSNGSYCESESRGDGGWMTREPAGLHRPIQANCPLGYFRKHTGQIEGGVVGT